MGPAALEVVRTANTICAQYAAQGLDLTLRQLYYQFVARDLIANKQSEYKRLGDIINKARMSGRLDWDFIVDRTRNVRSLAHWSDPAELVDTAARQFRTDRWSSQPARVEVWIEKDALVGVLEQVCPAEDVPYFSCRGYTSSTEVWGAGRRLGEHIGNGQRVEVIHLGDHDPSGIDMTRDIEDRLRNFIATDWHYEGDHGLPETTTLGDLYRSLDDHVGGPFLTINRIALNWDQVEEYDPPPNPAKLTDSRSGRYVERFGDDSWELDALEPAALVDLIRSNIEDVRDEGKWAEATAAMEEQRTHLKAVSDRWEDVVRFVEEEEAV